MSCNKLTVLQKSSVNKIPHHNKNLSAVVRAGIKKETVFVLVFKSDSNTSGYFSSIQIPIGSEVHF